MFDKKNKGSIIGFILYAIIIYLLWVGLIFVSGVYFPGSLCAEYTFSELVTYCTSLIYIGFLITLFISLFVLFIKILKI